MGIGSNSSESSSILLSSVLVEVDLLLASVSKTESSLEVSLLLLVQQESVLALEPSTEGSEAWIGVPVIDELFPLCAKDGDTWSGELTRTASSLESCCDCGCCGDCDADPMELSVNESEDLEGEAFFVMESLVFMILIGLLCFP